MFGYYISLQRRDRFDAVPWSLFIFFAKIFFDEKPPCILSFFRIHIYIYSKIYILHTHHTLQFLKTKLKASAYIEFILIFFILFNIAHIYLYLVYLLLYLYIFSICMIELELLHGNSSGKNIVRFTSAVEKHLGRKSESFYSLFLKK